MLEFGAFPILALQAPTAFASLLLLEEFFRAIEETLAHGSVFFAT
jgi:hypothetical protein